MSFEIKGVVHHIGPIEEIGEKGFRKSIIVIDTGGEYPQLIPVEFTGDKADATQDCSVGEILSVSFNLRGNEYNGRFYVNLKGWKIDKASTTKPKEPTAEKTVEAAKDELEF